MIRLTKSLSFKAYNGSQNIQTIMSLVHIMHPIRIRLKVFCAKGRCLRRFQLPKYKFDLQSNNAHYIMALSTNNTH